MIYNNIYKGIKLTYIELHALSQSNEFIEWHSLGLLQSVFDAELDQLLLSLLRT